MASGSALSAVIARFPEMEGAIRALAGRDKTFRGVCKDYGLACASFERFRVMPDAVRRPEVGDYHAMIAALESEISDMLGKASEAAAGTGAPRPARRCD